MGITDNNPVGFVHIGLSFSFVEGLLFSPLNHVTYVSGMCQHIFNYLRMPQHTLVLFRLDFACLVKISRRRKNTCIVEPASDLHNADTLGTPLEYLSNRRSCFFVDNKMVLIIGVFAIPIGCPSSNELATLLLNMKCGCGFFGYVLAVNLVNEIFQRHDISVLGSLCGQRIKVVVDSDETDSEEWEDTLQVIAGLLVITTEAGKVFDYNAVYTTFSYFLHHLFKLRTVKVSSGSPVVTEQSDKLHIGFTLNKGREQSFLSLNGICTGLAAVLNGQSNIGGCLIYFLCRSRGFHFLHKRICLSFRSCHLYYLLQSCTPKNVKLPSKFILPTIDDLHHIV